MSEHDKTTDKRLCPMTGDPNQRLESNAQTDAIRANFPTGIARPALRALVAAGFTSLEQLTAVSEEELSGLHGMGPKAVETLRFGLLAEGLSFRSSSEEDGSHQQ